MRIISKHHDYYDSALAHGADMSLVYERSTRVLPGVQDDLGTLLDLRAAPKRSGSGTMVRGRWTPHDAFVPGILLFCGRAFPFFEHSHSRTPDGSLAKTVLWSLDAVSAAVEASGRSGRWETFYPHEFYRRFCERNVRDFLAGEATGDRAAEAHARHATPVILYRRVSAAHEVETVLDPCLRDLGFFRLRDTFAAFQEIAMYLGGVLRTGDRPMVEIPDRIRAEKHGMDKTSFRRPPQTA